MRRILAVILGLFLAAPAAARPQGAAAPRSVAEIQERLVASQQAIEAVRSRLAPSLERLRKVRAEARRKVERAGSRRDARRALDAYAGACTAQIDGQLDGVASILTSLVRMRVDARRLAQAAARARPAAEERAAWTRFLAEQLQGVAEATAVLAARLERPAEGAAAGEVLAGSWSPTRIDALAGRLSDDGMDDADAGELATRLESLVERVQARFRELREERRSLGTLLSLLGAKAGVERGGPAAGSGPAPPPADLARVEPVEEPVPVCEEVAPRVTLCRTSWVAAR